jgi:hypothetical protein
MNCNPGAIRACAMGLFDFAHLTSSLFCEIVKTSITTFLT